MRYVKGSPRYWLTCLLAVCCAGLLATARFSGAEEPEKKTEAKADMGWKPLFDGKTLDGWEVTEFGTGGEVLVKDGSIRLDFGDGCTGVTWKKDFPKVDFEVRLQAQRVEGSDFFCGMTFPVEESHCSFVVGGWGGSVVGLSSVDGEYAIDNKTCRFMTFKKGQWYDIRLRVTKTRVTAWIDEKPVVDQETTGHKLALHPAVLKSRPFGLTSYSTSAALRKVELRKLTEEESQPVKNPVKIEPESK